MSLTKDPTEESMKISARNQLRGTVESVNSGDVMAEVVQRRPHPHAATAA